MPKVVDHDERRRQIADAVFRVTARDGLDAATLRHVAAEAGVTSGMVQHYFPSKDTMLRYAMDAARQRYETRMTAAIGVLGSTPSPRAVLTAMLQNLIPHDRAETDDGRVSLAFQAYAATHDELSAVLADDDALLLGHLTQLVEAAAGPVDDPRSRATALMATAEGLSMKVLATDLAAADAAGILDRAIDLLLA